MKLLAAGASMALVSGAAWSATFDLNLTGNVADFNSYTQEFNGQHYDSHNLGLSGLDSSNAITVSEGDIINTTVTLDQAYTIPTSPSHTDFLLFLNGSAFPSEDTGNLETVNFYDGGTLVKSYSGGSTTSGQLTAYAALFPPNNSGFTFDSFTVGLTITDLATPATLDSSFLSYSIVSPGAVPEPASWAMMVGGFGMIGGAIRRKTKFNLLPQRG
jgi:hypothetical protein